MTRRAVCLIVLVVALLATTVRAQSGQWLIEKVGGVWEVRERAAKPRRIADKYDVLTTPADVRCVKQPCLLEYSTATGSARPLFTKPPPLLTWTALPKPLGPPVAPFATDLQHVMGEVGVRGGADKQSPICSGEFPLQAPSCGETLDLMAFAVRWQRRPSEDGKLLTLVVGRADSMSRRRWDSISATTGEFSSPGLTEYLRSLQLPDRWTDVTLRLIRTEGLDASRVVRLPSDAEEREHEMRLASVSRLPELRRNLALLEEYLRMGAWSQAADVSHALLRAAPDSPGLREYALVGLCGSGLADEIARLRASLGDAGRTRVCQTERQGR